MSCLAECLKCVPSRFTLRGTKCCALIRRMPEPGFHVRLTIVVVVGELDTIGLDGGLDGIAMPPTWWGTSQYKLKAFWSFALRPSQNRW
jgi:hypothetical protein